MNVGRIPHKRLSRCSQDVDNDYSWPGATVHARKMTSQESSIRRYCPHRGTSLIAQSTCECRHTNNPGCMGCLRRLADRLRDGVIKCCRCTPAGEEQGDRGHRSLPSRGAAFDRRWRSLGKPVLDDRIPPRSAPGSRYRRPDARCPHRACRVAGRCSGYRIADVPMPLRRMGRGRRATARSAVIRLPHQRSVNAVSSWASTDVT